MSGVDVNFPANNNQCMKRITFLTILFVCGHLACARIHTVCNMPYSPGQHTTFASALAVAISGDTIYVHGSDISYGAITVNKDNIVVIGTGHNPNKQAPLVSSFTTITVQARNCQLIGLSFVNLTSAAPCAGTVVKRCKLTTTGNTTAITIAPNEGLNWLIEGNIFNSPAGRVNINFGGLALSNVVVRNNIFNGFLASGGASQADGSFLIVNNIFLSDNTALGIILNAVINNNIFYRSSPRSTAVCSMNHNISFQCANNDFSSPGVNNLVNVDPQFINFPSAGALFSYQHDYRLAPSSPGINSGSDGTDRGVFGGFGGKFSMTGEPAIAEITAFTITSPTTIPPGGTLTISVTSKRVQ
jgi:hypothetical protein